jgi:thiamine-monophosphate kinase
MNIPISKLGEFGLIERFKKLIKTDSSVIAGSGDDCAVLKFDKDKYQLFTCDMIVEGVDFRIEDSPYLIGRKALAIAISDIAACGGLPRYCLVSLGMPKGTSLKFVDWLFKGMLRLAKQYKINIVGGDLSRAGRLTIDISMLGLVEKRYLALRSGAKKKDIIFVTGELGGSILGKHLRFIPRLKEARYLVKNFKVNAMIDISDGLLQDLGHILKASKVGAVIYEDLIPISKPRPFYYKNLRGAKKGRGKQAVTINDALYMGEDFELLFTLPLNEAKKILRKKITGFKVIGEIVDKKYRLRLIDKKGQEKVITSRGFRHF